EAKTGDTQEQHLDGGMIGSRGKAKANDYKQESDPRMPFALAGAVRMQSPDDHANGTDEIGHCCDETGRYIRHAKGLDDLRQEEAQPVLGNIAAHIDKAKRDNAPVHHRAKPGAIKYALARCALTIEPALQPLALLRFEPICVNRSVSEKVKNRKRHNQRRKTLDQ